MTTVNETSSVSLLSAVSSGTSNSLPSSRNVTNDSKDCSRMQNVSLVGIPNLYRVHQREDDRCAQCVVPPAAKSCEDSSSRSYGTVRPSKNAKAISNVCCSSPYSSEAQPSSQVSVHSSISSCSPIQPQGEKPATGGVAAKNQLVVGPNDVEMRLIFPGTNSGGVNRTFLTGDGMKGNYPMLMQTLLGPAKVPAMKIILNPSRTVEVPVRKTEPAKTNLPPEVLSLIFERLSLKDRKNVRLVNRVWYDACNTQSILLKEKICIGTLQHEEIDVVMFTLFRSKRKLFNFEIYGIDFKKKPRCLFWKKCGRALSTLRLTRCRISTRALISIVKYCSGIQTLRFEFDDLNEMQSGVKNDDLDAVISEGMTNKSLQKLEIRSNSWQCRSHDLYWLRLISQFFRLFPLLSSFSLLQRQLVKPARPLNPLLVNVETAAHFQLVYETFVSTRMREIALNFLSHPKLEWDALSCVPGITKITEITIDLDDSTDLLSLSSFIFEQSYLSKIVCLFNTDVNSSDQAILDHFVSLVLRKLSLRELGLYIRRGIVVRWNPTWFTLFSSSTIKILDIRCCSIEFLEAKTTCVTDAPSMSSLSLQVKGNDDSSIVPLLRAFPQLKELNLSHISDDIISAVSNTTRLTSLSVNNLDGGNSFDDVQPVNISCLRYLKKLVIPSIFVSTSNRFEHLTYLHILKTTLTVNTDQAVDLFYERPQVIRWDKLRIFLLKCPRLKSVWIDSFIFPNTDTFAESLITCISNLEDLRFLYFANDPMERRSYMLHLTDNDLSMMFHQCPSLEVFVYEWIYVVDEYQRSHKLQQFQSFIHRDEFLEKYMPVYVDEERRN